MLTAGQRLDENGSVGSSMTAGRKRRYQSVEDGADHFDGNAAHNRFWEAWCERKIMVFKYSSATDIWCTTLWDDSYQPGLDLLSRVLPPGLVAYLHTCTDEVSTEDSQNQYGQDAPFSRRQRRILQQRRGQTRKGVDHLMTSIGSVEVGDISKQMSEVEDAQKIYRSMIDCFERANLPTLTDE